MATTSSPLNIVSWVTRLIAAGILIMAAMMKLTSDPGSVYMFEELLGAPAIARMGLGGVELLAAILILVPKTLPYGVSLATLLMLGALGAHFTKLGISIEVPVDAPEGIAEAIEGPAMFIMALAVLGSALATAFIKRADFPCKCCGGNCSTNTDSGATAG